MSDAVAPTSPIRRVLLLIKALVVRLTEIVLAAVGAGYVFVSDGTPDSEIKYLAWFDVVAVTYLIVGFFVVRRYRRRRPPTFTLLSPKPWINDLRRRSSFLLAIIASLTGLAAASDVLIHGRGDERDSAVRALAVTAVICAFTILHIGYAKFYRNLDAGPDGPGLRFPEETEPTLIDYLYFSITLGVSFAVSDVEIIHRTTRWHVMVHEVVSFFYNAGVLAIAVGVVTGR
jgi:uncharacterized membrane protein